MLSSAAIGAEHLAPRSSIPIWDLPRPKCKRSSRTTSFRVACLRSGTPAGETPDTVRVVFNAKYLGSFGPVARILVQSGYGDDVLVVEPGVGLPVQLDGGSGDNCLQSGSGGDLLLSGPGNDVLIAGTGRPALDGGGRLQSRRRSAEHGRVVGCALGQRGVLTADCHAVHIAATAAGRGQAVARTAEPDHPGAGRSGGREHRPSGEADLFRRPSGCDHQCYRG